MTKHIVIILSVLVIISCTNRHNQSKVSPHNITISGCYKTVTDDAVYNEDCPLELILTNNKKEYNYILKTIDTTYKGKASLDFEEGTKNKFIVLKGIEWDEFEGDLDHPENNKNGAVNTKEISMSLEGDTLMFMNDGNSMNSFTILSDCGRKWVRLIKQ